MNRLVHLTVVERIFKPLNMYTFLLLIHVLYFDITVGFSDFSLFQRCKDLNVFAIYDV